MHVPPLLVVEDETLIRLDLVEVLEGGGYTVAEIADSAGAIAEIDRHEELCGLVTDVNLGSGATGWDVARHARKKFPGIAVVYITGDSVGSWPAEGVPNSLILQKPFADAQIVGAITTLLNQSGTQSGQTDIAS